MPGSVRPVTCPFGLGAAHFSDNSLEYLCRSRTALCQSPDLEFKDITRLVVQFEIVLGEAVRDDAYALVDIDIPPKYTKSFMFLYTYSFALTLNVATALDIPANMLFRFGF